MSKGFLKLTIFPTQKREEKKIIALSFFYGQIWVGGDKTRGKKSYR